jgi:tetratricopeptide (TPR) repeat protein
LRASNLTALAIGYLYSSLCIAAQPVTLLESVESHRYRVLVQACAERSEATRIAEELSSAGYAPVEVVEDGLWSRVLMGSFDLEADAHMFQVAIQAGWSATSPRVVTEEMGAETEPPQATRPARLTALSASALPSIQDDPTVLEIESLRENGTAEELEARLQLLLSMSAEDQALHGYALNLLGHLELERGDRTRAREHFSTVAAGEVGADLRSTVDSLMRMAYFAWADGDHDTAYDRFMQAAAISDSSSADLQAEALFRAQRILQSQGQKAHAYDVLSEVIDVIEDGWIREQCLVDRVGLLLEMAETGEVGNHDEVRRAALSSLSQMSSDTPEGVQRRATVELMLFETHMRQPQPDCTTAAELGESYIRHYGSLQEAVPTRELAAAMNVTGRCQAAIGNTARAEELFLHVLTEIPPDAQAFRGFHPHAEALNGLAELSSQGGDREVSDELLREIITMYPDETITARIRQYRPDLVQE